jgi:hypothetical protein
MIGIARPPLRESKVMCKRIGAINCNVKTLESNQIRLKAI